MCSKIRGLEPSWWPKNIENRVKNVAKSAYIIYNIVIIVIEMVVSTYKKFYI